MEAEGPRSGEDGFKGLKDTYEDRTVDVFLPGLGHFYGMFDGHGGSNAAEWVASELPKHLGAAVRDRVANFDAKLLDTRRVVKRRRMDSERSKSSVTALEPEKRGELAKIEAVASEAEAVLGELRKLSYAPPPELVAVVEALSARKSWLDEASRTRGGGPDGARALTAALEERARDEARCLGVGEAAEARATVAIGDEAWRGAFAAAFKAADEQFLKEVAAKKNLDDGTTACVALLAAADDGAAHRRLVLANCGDSRAILCRGGRGLRLSTDHKPNNPAERRRIERLGGYVVDVEGVWRVTSAAGCGFGMDRRSKSLYLSVARALGDRQLKQPTPVVSADPELKCTTLDPTTDLFLVLVCDGITDCLDDNAIVAVAARHFGDPTEAARHVVRTAFNKGAADNVTALVVEFPWATPKQVAKASAQAARRDPAENYKPPPKKKDTQDAEPFDMFA